MKIYTLLTVAAAIGFAGSSIAAEPILAPVDPLAWAVANADWGYVGAGPVDSLRKIVNGQVTAHQASCSYTDPVTRSVMSVKCADPTNCVVCSRSAAKSANKLRKELSDAGSVQQAQGSNLAALTTYATSRANAMNDEAKWDNAQSTMASSETSDTSEGESKEVANKATAENASKLKAKKAEQIIQQIAQASYNQQQQQGSMVSTYVKAAEESLQKPSPAIVIFAGSDPLK